MGRAQADHIVKKTDYISWLKKWQLSNLNHWKSHIEEFDSLKKLGDEKDIPFLSFLFPANIWKDGVYPLAKFHQIIVEKAHKSSIPLVDITEDVIRGSGKDGFSYWVNSFDSHPNGELHQLYGNPICEHLLKTDSLIF